MFFRESSVDIYKYIYNEIVPRILSYPQTIGILFLYNLNFPEKEKQDNLNIHLSI